MWVNTSLRDLFDEKSVKIVCSKGQSWCVTSNLLNKYHNEEFRVNLAQVFFIYYFSNEFNWCLYLYYRTKFCQDVTYALIRIISKCRLFNVFFFQIYKCIHCFHIKVINKVLLVLKLLYFIFISKFCFPACVFQLLPQKTLRKKKLFHMKMHSLKMKDMFLHLPEISTGQFLNFIHYYRFSFLCKVFQ